MINYILTRGPTDSHIILISLQHDDQEACHIEWKRRPWNVTLNSCDSRARFVGDYDAFECGITIENVSLADAGMWRCQVEAYKFGGKFCDTQ